MKKVLSWGIFSIITLLPALMVLGVVLKYLDQSRASFIANDLTLYATLLAPIVLGAISIFREHGLKRKLGITGIILGVSLGILFFVLFIFSFSYFL